MKKILLAAALMTTLTATASAASVGPYVGFQGGYSFMEGNKVEGIAKIQNKNGFSGEVNAGYLFPLTDSLSLGPEIGIGKNFYSPKVNGSPYGVDANLKLKNKFYLPILARLQFQVNDDIYIYGKLGATYVSQSLEYNGSYQFENFSDNEKISKKEWQTTAGLGLGYNLTQDLSTEIAYTYVDGQSLTPKKLKNKTFKFQTVTLGLQYSF